MNRFSIAIDSSCNLSQSDLGDNILIPMGCCIEGQSVDTLDPDIYRQVYSALKNKQKVLTSLVSADVICDYCRPVLQRGEDLLLISLAGGISGMFHQMEEAKTLLSTEFPDRTICVCNSINSSLGEGRLAYLAMEYQAQGKSVTEAFEAIEEEKMYSNSYFVVDDLIYISQTGRLHSAVAIAANLLHVKAILRGNGDNEGHIVFAGKELGMNRAILKLAKIYAERAIDPQNHIAHISHADNPEQAEVLKTKLLALGAKDVKLWNYEVVSGSHVGPGTVALFFHGQKKT